VSSQSPADLLDHLAAGTIVWSSVTDVVFLTEALRRVHDYAALSFEARPECRSDLPMSTARIPVNLLDRSPLLSSGIHEPIPASSAIQDQKCTDFVIGSECRYTGGHGREQ